MASKGEIKILVTVTSTKIMRSEHLLRNVSQPLRSQTLKRCRSEVGQGRAGVRRESAVKLRSSKCRTTKSTVQSAKIEHDPRKKWLQKHRGEFEGSKVQPECGSVAACVTPPAFFPTPTTAPYPSPSGDHRGVPSHAPAPKPRGSRQINPIPRHKRTSHINAEHRRRNKIQNGFDTLKELVPAIREERVAAVRDSKCAMLMKSAEHCRELKGELSQQETELQALRNQIADLNMDIQRFQGELPATGIAMVEKPSCHIEAMYNDYLRERTSQDWKFWLFSFIMRPLFESYNRMVSGFQNSFLQSVREWAHEHLSLVNLRPCVLSALRQISLQSPILDDPQKMPEDAVRRVTEYCSKKPAH